MRRLTIYVHRLLLSVTFLIVQLNHFLDFDLFFLIIPKPNKKQETTKCLMQLIRFDRLKMTIALLIFFISITVDALQT